MKREKLEEALNEISEKHIAEAAGPKRRKAYYWLGTVAAVLAAALLIAPIMDSFAPRTGDVAPGAFPADSPNSAMGSGAPLNPETLATPEALIAGSLSYGQVAAPVYPKMAAYPDNDGKGYDAWWQGQQNQYNQPKGYARGTGRFFRDSIAEFLTADTDSNTVCSPVNIYMALAMLAETGTGETRQQILDLLGSDSIEALRAQAGYVWNAHYSNDGVTTLLLGNSLWLADRLDYDEQTADTLANDYYASVFHGDLADERMQAAFRNWIDAQTGNLLSEQTQGLKFDDNTALALASTIYYRAAWSYQFWDALNTEDIFHSPAADQTVTYMHMDLERHSYYRGDAFGAISLPLEGRSQMWLILPDEGVTPTDILTSGEAIELVLGSGESENCTVHLSLPKFDIVCDQDLKAGLQMLGITDAFNPNTADFSAISPGESLYVEQVSHAARVVIDEDGIVAAAYTVMGMDTTAMPAGSPKEIDFTLDRPFLFIITSRDDLPLFAGVVNQP